MHAASVRSLRRVIIVITLAGAALTALPACEKEKESRYRRIPTGEGYIAFIGAGRNDPLWPILRAGAERFEREQGLIEVRYAAPPVVSPEQQIALIRSFIGPTLRGLCVQVIEPGSLGAVLTQARQSGAQIVTLLRPADDSPVAGHVGYDERAVGKALADATVRYLNSQGTIMVLRDGQATAGADHPAGARHGTDRAMRDRYGAFMETIKPMLGIERWAEVECGGDPVVARRKMAELSARYPRVQAWVALAPWPLMEWRPAAGTSQPAAESPLPPRCKLITCGAEPLAWPYIASGSCPIVVGFNYADAGLKALQFCQAATQSPGSGGREYAIPIRFVTTGNLDEYKRDWAVWSAPTTAVP